LIVSGLMKIIGESNGRKKAHNIQQPDHAALFADALEKPDARANARKPQRTGTARAAAVVRYALLI
jgi:hypothetical protein